MLLKIYVCSKHDFSQPSLHSSLAPQFLVELCVPVSMLLTKSVRVGSIVLHITLSSRLQFHFTLIHFSSFWTIYTHSLKKLIIKWHDSMHLKFISVLFSNYYYLSYAIYFFHYHIYLKSALNKILKMLRNIISLNYVFFKKSI